MGRDWFASQGREKIELGDGDWVEIRKELTYGEFIQFMQATGLDLSEQFTFNTLVTSMKPIILSYVTDWSVTDPNGQRVSVSAESVESMHNDCVLEIGTAIARSVGLITKEKKAPTTKTAAKKTRKRKPASEMN